MSCVHCDMAHPSSAENDQEWTQIDILCTLRRIARALEAGNDYRAAGEVRAIRKEIRER